MVSYPNPDFPDYILKIAENGLFGVQTISQLIDALLLRSNSTSLKKQNGY